MRDLRDGKLTPEIFGWKAHYLSLLMELGIPVPAGVAVAHDEEVSGVELFAMLSTMTVSTDGHTMALAIRSSGIAEDSHTASHAGSLRTHLGSFSSEELTELVKDVRASAAGAMRAGVVVQKLVDLSYSGVAFSADPLTFRRDQHVVEWTSGNGTALVSGARPSELLGFNRVTGEVNGSLWPDSPQNLQFLTNCLARLEAVLGCPVDVEWGIGRLSGLMIILQVRPVIMPRPAAVALDTSESFPALPAAVHDHPKIKLRRTAHANGLRTAPAVAHVFVGAAELDDWGSEREELLDASVGRSLVLLYPIQLANKVVREFATVNSFDVDFFTEGCRRYSVRRYPTSGRSAAACAEVAERGLAESWLAVVLDQVIYDPLATGIVRCIADGYLVELGIGHFLPKGYITTSTFLVGRDFRSCHARREPQERAYHFINGHVVKEEPVEEQLNLSDDEVVAAVAQLAGLASANPGAALEFGLLRERGRVVAFLIDLAETDDEEPALTQRAVSSGVISPGVAAGAVRRVPNGSTDDNFNVHLLDRHDGCEFASETVYVADQASVDLLPLVYTAGPGCGFVFARAAVLAHLAVVIRERKIAAVRVDDETFARLKTASSIQINANVGGRVTIRACTERDVWEIWADSAQTRIEMA